jgi:hypothetical protein
LEKDDILAALSGHWKRPFQGGSVDVLRGLLLGEEKAFDKDRFYAKTIPIIQSSGTGKSRLVDELGKEFLTVSFVLRHPGDDVTWPPGDHEITKFLTCSTSYEECTAAVVALLSATLAEGNEFPVTGNNACCDRLTVCIPVAKWCCDKTQFDQMTELAKSFHDNMAPMVPNRSSQTELRSPFRISFIERTVEAAEQLRLDLLNHATWTDDHVDADTMASHEFVQKHLVRPARELIDRFDRQYQVPADPEADATSISSSGSPAATKAAKQLLLFAFDEAASLWVTADGKKTGNPFYALRRVLGLLKDIPIWSLLLSTQSTTGSLLPPRETDISTRMRDGRLNTIEPFLGLQVDIAAEEAVATIEGFEEEKRKPMSQFATVKHMTMFGRSLWRAYCNVPPSSLRDFALTKLIHNTGYDVENKNHVFAALASRLCLDVCMEEAEAIALAHEAVNSYLRIVISIDTSEKGKYGDGNHLNKMEDIDGNRQGLEEKSDLGEQQSNSSKGEKSVKFNVSQTGRRTGRQTRRSLQRMETVTPSEPIVAEIVADQLCKGANWSSSIHTLAEHLLSKGLVGKGLKGELFARLLCILARDFHLRDLKVPNDSFPYAKPFSVNNFLQTLFGDERFQRIKNFTPLIPVTRKWPPKTTTASFCNVFDNGIMNFSHFTNSDVLLLCTTMPELLQLLLRQQQALQLTSNEPDFDILLPIYFGDIEEEFDPSRTSAILISVKNRRLASHLPPAKTIHKLFSHTNDPVLAMLMDLGTRGKPAVDVQGEPKILEGGYVEERYVFNIHAEGAGVETYGCLQGLRLEAASKALLQQVLQMRDPRGIRDKHDEFCHRNKRGVYRTDWKEFYQRIPRPEHDESL